MKVKVWLYWELTSESYFYSLYELNAVGGPDGTEYHGEYIMDIGNDCKIVENTYGALMIEYKGELYDLKTTDSLPPIPFIYISNDGWHVKKHKFDVVKAED
jgi:hypothetical protein